MTLDMARISGGKVIAWWYSPLNGEARKIGDFAAEGTMEFRTPNWDQTGRDWILVLDDATKGYLAPGAA